jgi:hypothetical protein
MRGAAVPVIIGAENEVPDKKLLVFLGFNPDCFQFPQDHTWRL